MQNCKFLRIAVKIWATLVHKVHG